MNRVPFLLAAAFALYAFQAVAQAPATNQAASNPAEDREKALLTVFQKEESTTNSLGTLMVWVPAGFRVAQFETTQADFEKLTGSNPSKFPGARHPVESVSVEKAAEFCQLLTQREHKAGTLPKTYSYQLPTEADFEVCMENTGIDTAYTSFLGDRRSPIDVGSLPPNKLGLHDIRGNVWEWCNNGIARGGSYQSHEDYLRPSFRYAGTPGVGVMDVGFRVFLKGPAK